jgi:FtsP/CotA-like multicopper oxidase with cupredoxin domain
MRYLLRTSSRLSIFASIAFASPLACFATEVGPLTIFTADDDHNLYVTMRAVVQGVVIGGYKVARNNSLVVCDHTGARCADPYAGAVLQLKPRDRLIIDLSNKLQSNGQPTPDHCMVTPGSAPNEYGSDNSLLNLHTHGLLVSPYAEQIANGKAVFGDNIFSCTSSQPKNGNVAGDAMRYEITLNDTGLNNPHPLGVDWIHPHVHGIAKAQVSSGMSSMIEVGDINKQLCALPSPDGAPLPTHCDSIAQNAVKHLILKDAQLVKLASQPDLPDVYTNYADQNPDFCGGNNSSLSNVGECAVDLTTLQDATSGRWVFTINGVKAPHWEIAPDKYEVWRVLNGSANVTYRLSLQALASGGGIPTKAPFQVLDMDGASLVSASTSGSVPLPAATDILLMPSSRVDLLVQSPRENSTDVDYSLVNDNFQAGYAAADADVWPRITLATVTFKASRAQIVAIEPVKEVCLGRRAEFGRPGR